MISDLSISSPPPPQCTVLHSRLEKEANDREAASYETGLYAGYLYLPTIHQYRKRRMFFFFKYEFEYYFKKKGMMSFSVAS